MEASTTGTRKEGTEGCTREDRFVGETEAGGGGCVHSWLSFLFLFLETGSHSVDQASQNSKRSTCLCLIPSTGIRDLLHHTPAGPWPHAEHREGRQNVPSGQGQGFRRTIAQGQTQLSWDRGGALFLLRGVSEAQDLVWSGLRGTAWELGSGTYATEHWAKARYSSRTSRPRFSSLRNSCTHLQGTRFSELQPERILPEPAMSRHSESP